jgi:hypothetical protein
MLLHERDLGLHSEHDVAQPRLDAAVRRHAGEDPRRPLLIHQAARPVDRIDEQPPPAFPLVRAARQHEPLGGKSLRDEHQRLGARELLEPRDERLLAHAVHRVDRVPRAVVRDVAQRLRTLLRERRHDARADLLVQLEDRRKQPARVGVRRHARAAR